LSCADAVLAIELLGHQLWYRTKAKIKSLFWGGIPEESTAHPCPLARLPQRLVTLIISHLIYDRRTLLACSATCYSWYIAAAPHLHHTLTTDNDYIGYNPDKRYFWPRPLRRSCNLGLLPLVKRLRIRSGERGFHHFTPKQLGRRILSYFSALMNPQELGIDYLQVSSFMPSIQRHFGHLSQHFGSLPSRSPRALADRSCISLDPSRTFKTSSSTTPSPGMSRKAQPTRRSFPSPYPRCEDG
jgi:hypothetical protein